MEEQIKQIIYKYFPHAESYKAMAMISDLEKLYRNDIDLAYCAGIFNTGGIDVLSKELERLKHIGRKPSQIFQRYKPESPNVSDYLNECIEKAAPNLSKIEDVDKALAEIRGENRNCDNCYYEYPNYWGNPCSYCNDFKEWKPKLKQVESEPVKESAEISDEDKKCENCKYYSYPADE